MTLRVWDLATGETKTTLKGHTSWVNAVTVTPDGRYVVSGSGDNLLRHGYVSRRKDNTLHVWNLTTGETTKILQGHTDSVNAVAVTPDGRYVVSGCYDGTLRAWDLATQETTKILQRHTSSVNALTVTPDGRHVVSGSKDNDLRVWDVATGENTKTLQGHTDWVDAVAVTADGRYVVSSSSDKTLRIWDLTTGKNTKKTLKRWVTAIAATPEGHYAVFDSDDRTLCVWDLATSETKRTLQCPIFSIHAVAVTSEGRYVVAAHRSTLRVWDLTTGEAKWRVRGYVSKRAELAVTPDGRYVVSGWKNIWENLLVVLFLDSGTKTLRVWDLATGKTKKTFKGHTSWVNAVAVTPDSRYVVSSSDDTLCVWDLATGEIKWRLKGHTSLVVTVAVTPDGHYVVSSSWDNTLRLWDLKNGKELLTFTVDAKVTTCVATRDTRTIVAGDDFGRLHFLQLVEADETIPPVGDIKIQLLPRKERAIDS